MNAFYDFTIKNIALILSIVTMGCLIWSNLENRKSRQYQYRPHLVFQKYLENTFMFDYEEGMANFQPIFIRHFNGELEWIKINVKNIGVGFAKDLEIKMDYSEIVNELLKYEKDCNELYYSKEEPDFFGINSSLDVDICDYYDCNATKKSKTHYFNTLTIGEECELYLSIHVNLLGFICMINNYKYKNKFGIPYAIKYRSIDNKRLTQTGKLKISYSQNYDIGLNHREFNKLLNHFVNDGVDISKEVSVKYINTIHVLAE